MSKILVTFFSASGVTEKLAKDIRELTGGDLYEIRPAAVYTKEDLDWRNKASRSTIEMNDPASRPEMADNDADVAGHDVVFVGFPIWWYTAPRIINSFLEAYDFEGKKVILFATSGGSGIGKTKEDLEGCKGFKGEIVEAKRLGGRRAETEEWIKTLSL